MIEFGAEALVGDLWFRFFLFTTEHTENTELAPNTQVFNELNGFNEFKILISKS